MTAAEAPNSILFVTPPYHCGVVEVAGRWIPLNFVYLAGAARQAGVEAAIYDAMAQNDGYPEIEKRLKASRHAYVASSAMTATINDAIQTLALAKEVDPSTVTILGGVHPTFCVDEIFAATDAVDFIVCGEGEITLRELLGVLEEGGDAALVPGLAFRRDGSVVRTGKRPLHPDLDDLAAAWDLVDWPQYQYFVIPNSRLGAISTSRGCERDCSFCAQQKFWEHTWRARESQKVADEIELLFRSYGVNVFLVSDDYPTCDPERWEALLDALMVKELPIHLLMETRAADIVRDRKILWKYRKAGVVHIYIGKETGGELRLDPVDGREEDEAKLALELIHQHGMVSEMSFVLGFPDETPESVRRTLQTANSYNPDNAHFLALTPWPYTDMYGELKESVAVRDYSKYNLIDPVVKPKGMTLQQVETAIVDCYRRFYMRKTTELFTMRDTFKRNYLMRAMKLFMSSSFIMRKLTGRNN